MVNDDAPIPPSKLAPTDQDTLAQVALTIRDCVTALRTGDRMRGMDPLFVLEHLADLLDRAAQAQWDRPVSPEADHPLPENPM
jgi:hypothetical protein